MASRVHVQRTPPLRDRIIDLVETEFGRHVTVTEIVERLGVPRNSVLKAIQRGGFPAHIRKGENPTTSEISLFAPYRDYWLGENHPS